MLEFLTGSTQRTYIFYFMYFNFNLFTETKFSSKTLKLQFEAHLKV